MLDIARVAQDATKNFSLNRIFRKGFNYRINSYVQIRTLCNDEFIGNIPKPLLDLIISSGKDAKSLIRKTKLGFARASKQLEMVTELEAQNIIKKASDNNFIKKYIKIFIQDPTAVITDKNFGKTNEIKKIINFAQKELHKTLREFLPPGTKIKMKYLGSGANANAFKISFLDKNSNPVIEDYVLKTYKSEQASTRSKIAKMAVCQQIMAKMNDDEIRAFLRTIHKGNNISEENLEKIINDSFIQFKETQKRFLQEPIEKLSEGFNNFSKNPSSENFITSDLHGIFPESNVTSYIRFFAGHKILPKDNIILPDFFGFGNYPFLVQKYSSPQSPLPTRDLNLVNLGIISTDTGALNTDNIVNGRKTDMGGMLSSFRELQNKISLKYFKKIMNRPEKQRVSFVERYTQEAAQTKDLTVREKIMAAIEAAKIYIKSAQHDELMKH